MFPDAAAMPLLRSALALVFLLTLAAELRAQALPVQVRMDTGTFLYDERSTLVEVYLSFGAASLRFEPTVSGGFLAEVPVRLTLAPRGQPAAAPVASEAQTVRVSVPDPAALRPGQVVTEQVRLAVPSGDYTLSAVVSAQGGDLELRTDLSVPAYAGMPGPTISSVQLATRIAPAADPSAPTVKSGLDIRTNAEAFFGGDQREAFYYAEVYRPPGGAADGLYTALVSVTRADGQTPLPGTEQRLTRRAAPVDVVVGSLDVGELPTGAYLLRVAVLDASGAPVAQQSKRLFVVNEGVAPTDGARTIDDDELAYAAMSADELAELVAHVRLLARGRDARLVSALRTDDERRSFLARYWRAQDMPGMEPGAARRAFYARLAQVEQQYGRRGMPGYRTDQGRVALVYGPPTEIVRRTFNSDAGSYELWQYDNLPGEGRSIFVFAYRAGLTRMELVHSDVTGELSQPDWQNRLGNF